MTAFIAYYRASADWQGASGPGGKHKGEPASRR
jgi:hypothetical protein